jgi:hypothetical protein
MILFKKRFIEQILSREKTSTRRVGKKRWNVGSTHQLKISFFSESFATVSIKSVRQEKLGEISLDDARAEGFDTPVEFVRSFAEIHKTEVTRDLAQTDVWVIEFTLAD